MKLYHKTYGTGDPVIILHGLFGLGDNWRTIARMMETQFQCILVDLRNHGRSPHDPAMNFTVMAEDVIELMDDLDLDEAYLLGHSLGGKVAMQLATTYPERIPKLIVVDIAPKAYSPHHTREIEAIRALQPAEMKSRDDGEHVLRQYLGHDEATIQFLMKNLTRQPSGSYEWKFNRAVILSSYDQLMEGITSLHPFLGPVLFVRGGRSEYVTEADMLEIRKMFPEAVLESIPNAGHWVHADEPVLFTKQVVDFLKNGKG